MRELLSNSIDDGVTPSELADKIQGLGAFSDARAMTIARTELAFAYVQGNVQGWKDTGQVSGKRWILGDLHDEPDECDDCADAGDVGIDDDFVDGIDYPPAHPNCICDVLPVLVDQSGDGADNSGDS
jgi:F like protein